MKIDNAISTSTTTPEICPKCGKHANYYLGSEPIGCWPEGYFCMCKKAEESEEVSQ